MIGNHLVKHGDGAKDVAFQVEELDFIVKVCFYSSNLIHLKLTNFLRNSLNKFTIIYSFQKAKEQGAVFVRDIWTESDEFGTVRFATVKTVRTFSLI